MKKLILFYVLCYAEKPRCPVAWSDNWLLHLRKWYSFHEKHLTRTLEKLIPVLVQGSRNNVGKTLKPKNVCYPYMSALKCTPIGNGGMATCESEVYKSAKFAGDFQAAPYLTRETNNVRCYMKFTVIKSSRAGTRLLHSTCSNYCS